MSKNDLFFTIVPLYPVVRCLQRRGREKGLLKGELNKLAVSKKAMAGDKGLEPQYFGHSSCCSPGRGGDAPAHP